jgi:hypothetical protein
MILRISKDVIFCGGKMAVKSQDFENNFFPLNFQISITGSSR